MSRGISRNQEAILHWMEQSPDQVATSAKLQNVIPAARQSLSRALQSLEKRGLVRRLDAGSYRLNSPAAQSDSVFVGRQRELNELIAALEDILSGQGRLMLLVGELGIGKTRTAQQFAVHATLRGAQVLWGRCHAAQGVPPYWPWVQVIRSYIRGRDPERLGSEMGAGASDIAEIVTEIRESLPNLKPPPLLEGPEQARFRLIDSITKFLKAAAEVQPLVIVLDNLHWADRPSLLLLEFVVQEIAESPVLVVGTYRDTELTRRHPLYLTLGELAREHLFRRVPLKGLSETEMSRYIQATSGFTPSRDLVTAMHAQTEGNPFFMVQIVELLDQEGEFREQQSADAPGWRIQIPIGVHEAIGRRLGLLSEDCIQVLTVASVVGREFEIGLLERLLDGRSGDDPLKVLEEALAARVIEEIPSETGRYRFTHVLIQNTLAGELSSVRQARLHQYIGEALEEIHGSNVENHASALAYHFAEAMAVTGTGKLVRYSIMAGERALATYAHEEALVHFERGLAAKEEHQMDPETAALLFGLGRAQTAILERHQLHEAVSSLRRAFDYYAETGNIDLAVEVAQFPINSAPGQRTGVAQIITDALAFTPSDSLETGRLLSRYGRILGIEEGDYEGAKEALNQALAIARSQGDVALEMWTLANGGQVALYHLHLEEAIEKGQSAIELSDQANDPLAEVFARFYTSTALRRIGDLAGWRQQTSAMIAPAEMLRDRYWVLGALESQGHACFLQGEWEAARDVYHRGLENSPREPRILTRLARLEYEVGKSELGGSYLDRLIEAMHMTAPGPALVYAYTAVVIPLIARVTGVVDRFDVSRTAAETVLISPLANPNYALHARVALALLAVQTRDTSEAFKQYESLKQTAAGVLYSGFISVDRLRGLLAQSMGNSDQALSHFKDSHSFCNNAGYLTEMAWTCCDYADALLERGGRADRGQARALLEECVTISRGLNMHPLANRALERVRRIESQFTTTRRYPDGLTQREVEVLRLIATGRSNQEVAGELVLSLRTVERHITNIYGKINARGRADATSYTLGNNLIEQN